MITAFMYTVNVSTKIVRNNCEIARVAERIVDEAPRNRALRDEQAGAEGEGGGADEDEHGHPGAAGDAGQAGQLVSI